MDELFELLQRRSVEERRRERLTRAVDMRYDPESSVMKDFEVVKTGLLVSMTDPRGCAFCGRVNDRNATVCGNEDCPGLAVYRKLTCRAMQEVDTSAAREERPLFLIATQLHRVVANAVMDELHDWAFQSERMKGCPCGRDHKDDIVNCEYAAQDLRYVTRQIAYQEAARAGGRQHTDETHQAELAIDEINREIARAKAAEANREIEEAMAAAFQSDGPVL